MAMKRGKSKAYSPRKMRDNNKPTRAYAPLPEKRGPMDDVFVKASAPETRGLINERLRLLGRGLPEAPE
jgi:hypothetical protein